MYNKNDRVIIKLSDLYHKIYDIICSMHVHQIYHLQATKTLSTKTKLPRWLVGAATSYPDPGLSYKRRRWAVAIPQAESTLIQQVAHGFIPTYTSEVWNLEAEKRKKKNNILFFSGFLFSEDVWWLELGFLEATVSRSSTCSSNLLASCNMLVAGSVETVDLGNKMPFVGCTEIEITIDQVCSSWSVVVKPPCSRNSI